MIYKIPSGLVCLTAIAGLLTGSLLVCYIWQNANGVTRNNVDCFADEDEDYRCQLSSRSGYKFIANYNDSEVSFPGCRERKIWLFIRHGTRKPDNETLRSMYRNLTAVRSQILDSYAAGNSKLPTNIIENLSKWKITEEELTSPGRIVQEGERELMGIANRMKMRFPRLFFGDKDNVTFKFVTSPFDRSYESAVALARGFFENENDSRINWNSTKEEYFTTIYKCDRWYQEVIHNPDTLLEQRKFAASQLFQNITRDVSDLVGVRLTDDDLTLMYKRCAIESARNEWEPIVPWCQLFTIDQLKAHEFHQDMTYYYNDGYPHTINYKQACVALVGMNDFFTNKDKGPVERMKVFVTHTPIFTKLVSILGLFRDDPLLTADSFSTDTYARKWKLSRIAGFSASIMFVFYDCDGIGDSVVLMHQERLVQIPGCPKTGPCPLERFRKLYPCTKETCRYKEMCSIDPEVF